MSANSHEGALTSKYNSDNFNEMDDEQAEIKKQNTNTQHKARTQTTGSQA